MFKLNPEEFFLYPLHLIVHLGYVLLLVISHLIFLVCHELFVLQILLCSFWGNSIVLCLCEYTFKMEIPLQEYYLFLDHNIFVMYIILKYVYFVSTVFFQISFFTLFIHILLDYLTFSSFCQ